jgi:hypothetical protein
LPLFSSDVFLFEPTNKGCNNVPLFVALAYLA